MRGQVFFQSLRKPWVFWFFCLLLSVVLYGSRILALFTTAPVLLLTLGQGPVAGLSLWFFTTAFVCLSNPLDAGLLVLSSGFACVLAGLLVRNRRSVSQAIWKSMGVITIMVAVAFGSIQSLGLGERIPFIVEMKQDLYSNLDHFYSEMKVASEEKNLPEVEGKREFFHFWALALLPGGLVAMTAFTVWMYFIMLRKSVAQFGFEAAYCDLSTWRSPEPLVWAVIMTLFALVLKVDATKILTANVMLVLAMVYLFQGISILVYVVKNATFSPILKFTIYLGTILFFKVMAILLIGIGLMDVWINFRKLKFVGGGKVS